MSLINEALKKAQRDRQHNTGMLLHKDDRSQHGAQVQPQQASPWPWVFASITVVVVSLLIGVALYIISGKTPTPEPVALTATQVPIPASEKAPMPISAPNPVADIPSPLSELAPKEAPAAEAKTPPTPQPRPESPPKRITADPKIVDLLKQISVTGVLLSDDEGQDRIYIDGQVYWDGDTLNPQLQVKIAEIRGQAVDFVDESGVRYTKRF